MTTRSEIRQTLMNLISEEMGDPIVLSDTQSLAAELGMDSVDFVSLVMHVERHFRIHLTHEELRGAVCFGDLVSLIEHKLSTPSAAIAA